MAKGSPVIRPITTTISPEWHDRVHHRCRPVEQKLGQPPRNEHHRQSEECHELCPPIRGGGSEPLPDRRPEIHIEPLVVLVLERTVQRRQTGECHPAGTAAGGMSGDIIGGQKGPFPVEMSQRRHLDLIAAERLNLCRHPKSGLSGHQSLQALPGVEQSAHHGAPRNLEPVCEFVIRPAVQMLQDNQLALVSPQPIQCRSKVVQVLPRMDGRRCRFPGSSAPWAILRTTRLKQRLRSRT